MEVTHSNHRLGRSRSIAALLAATALLAAVPVASAQTVSPTDDQYDSSLELISEGGRGPGQAAPPPSAQPGSAAQPGGGLPFTGLDVAGLLAAAVALGGSGLVLRQLARRHSPSDGQGS
jgi:hypothetical protein